MFVRSVWWLPFVLSCATQQPATRSETPKTETKADAATTTESTDDVARAWEDDTTAKAAPQRPPPEPLPQDRAKDFKDALSAGSDALKRSKFDDAKSQAERAVKEAATLDGDARTAAGQLLFKVELASGDTKAAQDAVDAWRNACGPEHAENCRAQANVALAQLAKKDAKNKALSRDAAEAVDDGLCAAKAEKADKPQPCEASALSRARKSGDGWLMAKLLYAQGLRDDDSEKKLINAEKACSKPQCAGIRKKVLQKLYARAKADSKNDEALMYALREIEVGNENLTPQERRFTRTNTLDAACAAYEKDKGRKPGECRTLEKKTLGYWTFRDWSKDKPLAGLTPEQVKVVNEQYAPLLQECLAEQAKRMTPPDAQKFDIRWVVFSDGRVGEAHLRKDIDTWPLADCLRAQFVNWRYPRFEGDYQDVGQSFTVHANEYRVYGAPR
jgi:hypothetical protein